MKTLKWIAVLIGLTCLGGQFAPVHAQGIDTQYEPILQLGRGGIFSLDWSPDGNMLAVAGYAGVWIYTPTLEDIANFQLIQLIKQPCSGLCRGHR